MRGENTLTQPPGAAFTSESGSLAGESKGGDEVPSFIYWMSLSVRD